MSFDALEGDGPRGRWEGTATATGTVALQLSIAKEVYYSSTTFTGVRLDAVSEAGGPSTVLERAE